jgi:6-pyruvoyltetrahydropterin/6-carboxytetrahydropterin synthase
MRAYLSRRYLLSASHRLYSEAYSEEKNRAVYGKCSNPHGHGHNYVVEVTVGGRVDPVTGMVCNLTDLDSCVQKNVIDRFDHTNLNFDERFSDEVPTTENLCIAIHDLLAEHFVHADLERVRVEETRNNFFEYAGRDKHGTSSSRS